MKLRPRILVLLATISAGCSEPGELSPAAMAGCYALSYDGDPSKEGNLEVGAPAMVRLDTAAIGGMDAMPRYRLLTPYAPILDTMMFVPAWTARTYWTLEADSAHLVFATLHTGLHLALSKSGDGLKGIGDTWTDYGGEWRDAVQAMPVSCHDVRWADEGATSGP